MNRKTIVFTAPGIAEVNIEAIPELKPDSVLLKTEYTVISTGTERANLLGVRNTNGAIRDDTHLPKFPRIKGYCGVGRVLKIGPEVTQVSEGDRAVIYFGVHTSYNVVPEKHVIRIDDDTINMLDAAPTVLTHIALGGVRMAELELAESVMVMGLGVLGISAVELCRMSGAYPIIAVDPNPKRREKALSFGADIALDPKAKDFTERVLGVTCGEGVNVVIEVSGADIALDQALECTARMARVVLLGCTRENNRPTDYYHLVHYKGVKILGAHTFVRPEHDSRRGYWTYRDDCKSVLALISGERISPGRIIEEIYLPEQAPEVFKRLAEDPNFPIGVAFDWRNVK